MKWAEFVSLLAGIGPNTALGRVVSIRAENDKNVLKHFTPAMHRIRNEWRKKGVKKKDSAQTAQYLEKLKQTFISMAGGVSKPPL